MNAHYVLLLLNAVSHNFNYPFRVENNWGFVHIHLNNDLQNHNKPRFNFEILIICEKWRAARIVSGGASNNQRDER